MITTKPNVDPNGMYSQTQAAAALGVDRHTVKRYEDNGYISFRIRKADKRKVTTGAQIIKCWQSTYL